MHRHTCRPAAGSRLTRSGFPGVLAVLLSCGAAFGQPNEDEGVLQRVRKQVLSRAVPYAPPDRISKRAPDPAKKEVTAELNVQFAEVDVEHPTRRA